MADLGRLLAAAGGDDSVSFAERVHKAFVTNDYGVLDGLAAAVAGPMGARGRAKLRALFEKTIADTPPAKPRGDRTRDEHDHRAESRLSAAASGLMAIADAEGDVDAFICAAEASAYSMAHVGEVATAAVDSRSPGRCHGLDRTRATRCRTVARFER